MSLTTTLSLPDRVRSSMILPKSKETFFNTKWKPKNQQLCAYDMLFHPPDYNPKSARSDRQEPKIIRQNIWDQEYHKRITSTTHFMLGRPTIKTPDLVTASKLFIRSSVKNENPHMRLYHVLEWAALLNEGKPSVCDD